MPVSPEHRTSTEPKFPPTIICTLRVYVQNLKAFGHVVPSSDFMKVGQKQKNAKNDTHSVGYWTITPVSYIPHFCIIRRVYQTLKTQKFWLQ